MWLRTLSSRLTSQDRLRGVRVVDTVKSSSWSGIMSNMIIGSAVRTTVECQHPLREVGHMQRDDPTTGIHIVTSEGIQSTPEILDLMQDQFWYKVWSTGT